MATPIKEQLVDNIIGHWDFRTGSINDQSSVGNDCTFNGTPYWSNSSSGRALRFTSSAQDQYVTPGVPIVPATGAFTVYCHFKLGQDFGANAGGIFAQYFDVNNDRFTTFITSTTLSLQIGAALNYAGSFGPGEEYRVAFVRDGSNNVYIYVNGQRVASGTNATNVDQQATTIGAYDQGAAQRYFDGDFYECLVFDAGLTAQQVSQLYSESLQEAHLEFIPNKTVLPEASAEDITGGSMFAMFDGRASEGVAYDLSGNGVDGTPSGEYVQVEGINGTAIELGDPGSINYGAAAWGPLADGASAVSFETMLKVNGSSGDPFEMVIAEFNSTGNGWNLRVDTSGAGYKLRVGGRSEAADSYQSHVSTDVYSFGAWLHVVGILDFANDNVELYVSAAKEGETAVTFGSSTFDHSASASADQIGSGGGSEALCTVDYVRQYSAALTPAQITTLYKRSKGKVGSYDTGQDWNESVANVSSGFIENSGFQRLTGNWQVIRHGGNNKALESQTSFSRAYAFSSYAFGTWNFKLTRGGAAAAIFTLFIASALENRTGANQFGYTLDINSNGAITLQEMAGGSVSTKAKTSDGFVSTETDVEVVVTRSASGEFNMYHSFDGGLTFALTPVSTGSNPFTDTTVTESTYLVLDASSGCSLNGSRYSPIIIDPTA